MLVEREICYQVSRIKFFDSFLDAKVSTRERILKMESENWLKIVWNFANLRNFTL